MLSKVLVLFFSKLYSRFNEIDAHSIQAILYKSEWRHCKIKKDVRDSAQSSRRGASFQLSELRFFLAADWEYCLESILHGVFNSCDSHPETSTLKGRKGIMGQKEEWKLQPWDGLEPKLLFSFNWKDFVNIVRLSLTPKDLSIIIVVIIFTL